MTCCLSYRTIHRPNEPKIQVILGALHIKDHLSYLEVDYTKAYLQCVTGENGQGWEEQAPLVQAAIPVVPTAAVA